MCGIMGYSGTKFNKYKFNILGLYNDTRGGDSTGVFINNGGEKQLKYGHGETKLYAKFIENGSELDLNKANVALGHCRKASVGGIGLAQAQPVVINNEHGEPVFVMIHNGTLINYKELATKYGVEFGVMETDSQIFCKTVWAAGYKVLGEYDGAGAFIFWDSRDGDDSIKIFKGASMLYLNESVLYIERPLFMIKDKNSMWISSMDSSLKFINDNNSEIINVKHNTLITVKNGDIIGEDAIDRSERKSCHQLQYNKTYYDNDYDSALPQAYGYQYGIDFKNKNDDNKDYGLLLFRSYDSSLSKPKYAWKKKIYFDSDGLYKIESKLCNGYLSATDAGYIDGIVDKNDYWFYNGVLMNSYFDYLCAVEFAERYFKGDTDDILLVYLAKFSPTPIPLLDSPDGVIDYDSDMIFYVEDESNSEEVTEFTGEFSPYFSFTREVYQVRNGIIRVYSNYAGKNVYRRSKELMESDDTLLNGDLSRDEIAQIISAQIL